MRHIGINTSADPLEGLVRFLVFVVLFTLLYRAAQFIKAGNNAAMVIAFAIAAMTTIFIPSTVLIAAATSYALVTGVVLLGLPIGLCVFLYMAMKGQPLLRVGLMALLIWMMHQMKAHLVGLVSPGTPAVLKMVPFFGGFSITPGTPGGLFAASPLAAAFAPLSGLLDIAIVIAWIFLIWSVISGIGGKAADVTGLDAGEAFQSVKEKGAIPFTKEHRTRFMLPARDAFDSAMAQYDPETAELREMKELGAKMALLEHTKDNFEALPDTTPEHNVLSQLKKLRIELTDAEDQLNTVMQKYRKVKRTTFKHQRKIRKVIKNLRKYSDHQTQARDLEVLEGQILSYHKDTYVSAQALASELIALAHALDNAQVEPFDPDHAKGTVGAHDFDPALDLVEAMIDHQEKVITDLRDVASRVKPLLR